MEPYALFLDLDGTLMGRSGTIAPEDYAALAQAQANGHYVILNTGRAPAFVPECAKKLRADGMINGSVCVTWQGKRILQAEISRRVLREVCHYYLSEHIWGFLEGETGIYYFHDSRGHEGWLPITAEDDFETIYARDCVYKITAQRENTPEGLAMLQKHFLVILHPGYTEAILRGYDKASGMQLLCEKTGIPRERCIAFGDSRNDLDMFRFAGISVAVGNALDEVKAQATCVTASVQEAGVSVFLRQFGLI